MIMFALVLFKIRMQQLIMDFYIIHAPHNKTRISEQNGKRIMSLALLEQNI